MNAELPTCPLPARAATSFNRHRAAAPTFRLPAPAIPASTATPRWLQRLAQFATRRFRGAHTPTQPYLS